MTGDLYRWILNTSTDRMASDEAKAAREACGLTQKQLGLAFGIKEKGAQQHISRAENELGLRGAQAKVLRMLLEAKKESE